MPHFMKNIDTEIGNLNFYFNQVPTEEGISYLVSTIDRTGKAHILYMIPSGNQWIINNDKPAYWMHKIEPELSNAIFANLFHKSNLAFSQKERVLLN